ncbi:hypothetical protein EIK77_010807 [Talaromyces pinophilus]|nr:hypothetical protein EIK77_010807 [Talaromyces pinophilus]
MMAFTGVTDSEKVNMNKIKNKRKRKKMFNTLFLKILITIFFFLGYKLLFLPEILFPGIILFSIGCSIMPPSKMASTRTTRKFLSFQFLFLLFFIGIDYLPWRTYTSSSELSSRSTLGIGVLADVVLMSTFVEVTQTVPPPPAATATASAATAPAPAPAPDGTAPAAQATDAATDTAATATATATATADVATNTAIGASVTASGVDGSQATASGGGGQAMVQVPGTTAATSTTAAAATETGTVGASTSPNSGEVQVSGLADGKTAFVSLPTAPSGITTSPIRGKSSPTATSTPSTTSTSTSTSTSSTQKFPTYAAGLASGTAIIAAAGGFVAFYLVRRSNRRYRQRRKPNPVNEIGQVSNNNNNNRPFSIRKVSELIGMTNLSHKPCGDGNKLTSMKPPPDIDPETSWPRGYVPPDPEELRERMDDEKRRSGGSREGFVDSAVDLGIGYVSSVGSGAGAAPGDKRDGYFDGYDGHGPVQARPLSEVSMPEHMKPFMTPLQPRHNTQGFAPEPVDRAGAISPAASSIYSRDFSRRESIVTSFGEIHAKIDGNSNFNAHREEYRIRKEQARQFGTYDYVEEEEESPDGWREQHRSLEGSERPEVARVDEYSSPYTAQLSTANQERGGIGQHDDYFSTHHSVVNPDNRESQYEDIDLSRSDPYAGSQNDPYTEETTNSNKRNSGGYFGRFFGRGSGR